MPERHQKGKTAIGVLFDGFMAENAPVVVDIDTLVGGGGAAAGAAVASSRHTAISNETKHTLRSAVISP